MPYLDNIISTLNETWKHRSLCFVEPHTIKAYGIAEAMYDVTDEGKMVKYPAIIDEYSEAIMIVPDDSYSLILYHNIDSIVNTTAPKSGFGDSPGDQIETVNMSLVVIAFRSKVKKAAHYIEAALKDGIPDSMKITDTEFRQSTFLRVGNSSFDKMAILNREYSEVEINYPNIMLLEMKYRIDNTYRKGCLNLCT